MVKQILDTKNVYKKRFKAIFALKSVDFWKIGLCARACVSECMPSRYLEKHLTDFCRTRLILFVSMEILSLLTDLSF